PDIWARTWLDTRSSTKAVSAAGRRRCSVAITASAQRINTAQPNHASVAVRGPALTDAAPQPRPPASPRAPPALPGHQLRSQARQPPESRAGAGDGVAFAGGTSVA